MDTHSIAEVNNTHLYYEIAGASIPIVMIHGYTLDTRMWDDQMDAFTQKYQVIRYDLRGFGKSALPAGESFSHHEDLKALLDHLKIKQAHIMGNSLGAGYAINFALAYPEMTKSLIPADTSALDGFWWPDQLNPPFEKMNQAASNADLNLARQTWLDTDWFLPAREKPEVAARLKQIVDDYSCWHFNNDEHSHGVEPSANEQLDNIKAPTLVVIGERDLSYYNHPLADRLVDQISNAKKVIIPKVGHMSNMEDPNGFNEAVLSFLANVN